MEEASSAETLAGPQNSVNVATRLELITSVSGSRGPCPLSVQKNREVTCMQSRRPGFEKADKILMREIIQREKLKWSVDKMLEIFLFWKYFFI